MFAISKPAASTAAAEAAAEVGVAAGGGNSSLGGQEEQQGEEAQQPRRQKVVFRQVIPGALAEDGPPMPRPPARAAAVSAAVAPVRSTVGFAVQHPMHQVSVSGHSTHPLGPQLSRPPAVADSARMECVAGMAQERPFLAAHLPEKQQQEEQHEQEPMLAAVRQWQFDICRPAGERRLVGQAAIAAPTMGQFAPMQQQQQQPAAVTVASSGAARPLVQPASPAAASATIDEVLQQLQDRGGSGNSAPRLGGSAATIGGTHPTC